MNGSINANGDSGKQGAHHTTSSRTGGGGGGSGGNIFIWAVNIDLSSSQITTLGGVGGSGSYTGGDGGNGGNGWTHLQYCNQLSGNLPQDVYTETVSCYLVRRLPGSSTFELTLPEAMTNYAGYRIQNGLLVTTTAGVTQSMVPVVLHQATFSFATLDVLLSAAQPSTATLTLDIGADNTVEWSDTRIFTQPVLLNVGNISSTLTAYVMNAIPDIQGNVTVPIRVALNSPGKLFLTNFEARADTSVDLTLSSGISADPPLTTEGKPITLTIPVLNSGRSDSGPAIASVYARPVGASSYIGSVFIPDIPAGKIITTTLLWNTWGFTGTVPLGIVIDPQNRLLESNENNNVTTTTVKLLTRPDLQITSLELSNVEPQAGETVSITVVISNAGESSSEIAILDLIDGNTLTVPISTQALSTLGGNLTTTLTFTWTPTTPGPKRLLARVDSADRTLESDESNNEKWVDLYTGFGEAILIDSGTTEDTVYTDAVGYGYLDEGQPDQTVVCGNEAYKSQRLGPDGEITYRFDHLLPLHHYYHLDIVLYECDNAGREENIWVDGVLVAGPINLASGRAEQRSIRLDPALYADHTIEVKIKANGIDGAVVGAVNLYDIDYRYLDSGAGFNQDPAYPGGLAPRLSGYLNGITNTTWGTLPISSVRIIQTGNTLSYRFDGLNPARRYQLFPTFWQPSGTGRIQSVFIDGQATGTRIDMGDYQIHQPVIDIPLTAYASDGSIQVSIVREDAKAVGAMINELALEEFTLQSLASDSLTYSWMLGPGAHLISLPLRPAFTETAQVLNSIAGKYSLVMSYKGCDTADPWKRYDPAAPPYANDLKSLDETVSFWITMKVTGTLIVTGTAPVSSEIRLCPGWNMPGYPYLTSNPVTTTLVGIAGQYNLVYGYAYTDTVDPWKRYDPVAPPYANDLKQFQPGWGYWIRVQSACTWRP